MNGCHITGIIACLVLSLVIAGCVSQSQPSAGEISTPFVTTNPTVIPVSAPTTLTDPLLQGDWYLKQIGSQGGTAPLIVMNTQITIKFDNTGIFQGTTGCNNYHGQYLLTGQKTFNGMGMTIGPITTSTRYCADVADTERTYFQVLQKTNSYVVNSNGQLTLTDNLNSNLVFTKDPSTPGPRF